MPKQNFLVELINALSTNEKRYFKLFSSLQPGEKRYLKLFDALEGKAEYNLKALTTETGFTTKQLTDAKYYLNQILLQSLQNYDNQSTSFRQLQNNKENAISLLARRQFAFALDIIEKAIERAWELEAFEMIDEMLVLRNKCINSIKRYSGNYDLSEVSKKKEFLWNELVDLFELNNNANKYHAEANDIEAYKKLLKHPLLSKGTSALHSLRAKCLYFEIWIKYYISAHNATELADLHRNEQLLYKQNPILKVIAPQSYVNNAIRLSNTETSVGNNLKAYNILQEVGVEVEKETLEFTFRQMQSLKLSIDTFKLWPLRHLHRFSEAVSICDEYYEEFKERSEADKITVFFEYALSLMYNNNTAKAADIMDEILRIKSNARSDIQPYMRVLAIMIQLELGNYSLIPHLIKATKLWLKKQGGTFNEFELFFKYAIQIAQSTNRSITWRKLQAEIKAGEFQSMDNLIQFGYWVGQKV